jgi:hypothetical protein
MPSNDYAFLTRWQVEGKAEEAYEILTDLPGYLRWWHEVYLAVEKIAPAARDGLGETHRLLTRGKLPYRDCSGTLNPYSSKLSTNARQLASMMLSETPTVPQVSRPFVETINTRVRAAVPRVPSMMRTL